jgi:hypothetical protein
MIFSPGNDLKNDTNLIALRQTNVGAFMRIQCSSIYVATSQY